MKKSFFPLIAGILLGATFAGEAPAARPAKPNILFIVGDDMGYADVGFHQCKDIPTPSLDALAASGVQFSNGYVSGPYCSPTRAGLLTGRYQQRFGHEFNPAGGTQGLPLTEKTIADRLKAAGYVTGLVGKWHLGAQPSMHPQQRGFDEFFGFLGGAHSYKNLDGILRGTEQVSELDYTTDAFGREAVSFIERHQAHPWFLYLAFNAVHTPMEATDDRLARFSNVQDMQRRTYDAMMLAMDEAIGKVLKKLADSGQEKNTLVVFISDNGGPTMKGVTINGSSNLPLRGSKRTTLEGGIRVPFLVSWPGRIKPGVFHSPVIQLDLNATALAAAGVQVSDKMHLDGINLLPYLASKKADAPHEMLYWRLGQQMAIRKGDYKLIRYDSNYDTNTGEPQPVTAAKLYNLREDIGESKDLAATMPEKVKELQTDWDSWNATLAKPLWGKGSVDSDGKEPGTPGKQRQGRTAVKPNMIFILCDDLGYNDLGCYGSTLNRTPNIDRLAKEGVRFTDCYAAANVCSPSRAALMTGRYPIRSGIVNVLHPWQTAGIDSSEVTMPEMLREAGYYTGMVGKWHLGHHREHLPLQHGFQEYFGIPYSNDMKPCIYVRGNEVENAEVDQTQLTKTYTKEALRFIEGNKDQPFLLYLAHNMPHVPLFASDQFRGKSKNGLYGDVIEELDWSVGEITGKLQELNLAENTLIVFSSDNGPWLTQGPNGGSANPLFQGKMTTWEGGHRVPAIAYWKGKIKPGTYSGVITLMDWFPTFMKLSQARLPDNRILDGCDLTDIILKKGKRANEEFFFFQGARISACRSGDYKLILPDALRKGNQFVPDVPAHDTLLFNLRKDVGETTNLVKTNPAKVDEMSYNLDEFRISLRGLKGKAGEPRPKDWPR